MTPYIKKFIDAMSPNICWEIYPEYIKGFTEEQVDIYAKLLSIEINNAFRQWLLTFGACSGGLFLSHYCHHYHASGYSKEYLEYIQQNPLFNQEMYEDGRITKEQLSMNPFALYWENETDYYFILTKDPELFVWFYTESDNKIAVNTGLKFDDFLMLKLGQQSCSRGTWFNKKEVLKMSSSYIFE